MERVIWNEELETLSPGEQHTRERDWLGAQLEYVFSNSPFYQRKLREADLSPRQIREPEDLPRLGFTTKEELRESQLRAPPFGDYLAAPKESLSVMHRTSGSTGRFLFTTLTAGDMAQTNECGARAFWAAGLRPRHTVVHCLNYSLWMGGFTDHRNLEATGATVVPFGVGSSARLLETVREGGIDAISCTPSYPRVLETVARRELGIDPADLGLELGLFGGEPGIENPSFRGRIEEAWGMRAANANYGMAEAVCNFASECAEDTSLHFVGQGALLAQLIDPESGEDLPLTQGAIGELVLTHLNREAQPLIRYRTRDVIECLATGACRCGRTGFRFAVVGRSDDMVHVRGVNVFPTAIAAVLQGFTPGVTGEFQIVLSGPGPHDRLDIAVERGEKLSVPERQELRQRIEKKLRDELSFTARLTLVEAGSIPRTEMGKTARLVRTG